MKLLVPASGIKNIVLFLRRAGYRFEKDAESAYGKEKVFIRLAGRLPFPRFHLYAKESGDGWELNLHLDQKGPSYGGSHRHTGEYEGEIVENEMERILSHLPQLMPN